MSEDGWMDGWECMGWISLKFRTVILEITFLFYNIDVGVLTNSWINYC
jgi:hypothetical protein